jgi:hypothetical protein
MKCKKFKEQIVLYLYGELSEEERQALEQHLKTCSACSQDLAYTQSVFNLIDEADTQEAPEARWEKCWEGIHTEIQQPPRRRRRFVLSPAWAMAAAGIIMIFALGIFIGRFWVPSQPSPLAPMGISSAYTRLSLQEHFDNLKPLLIEYSNYSGTMTGDASMRIDREIVRSLLIQNFLLMRMVAEDNPTTAQLLEDIDLVLREITNMERSDRQAPSMIKELIHQREILFKIDILQKT